MGRLRTLARTFQEFFTNHVTESDVPAIAADGGGYGKSTRIGFLLLKEEIDKLLRKFEGSLDEMPGMLDIFGIEKSPDHTSFSK